MSISHLPFVLNHSPNREELEWNVDKNNRVNVEFSYEQALKNIRYVSKEAAKKIENNDYDPKRHSSQISLVNQRRTQKSRVSTRGTMESKRMEGKEKGTHSSTIKSLAKAKDDILAHYPQLSQYWD